MERITVEGNANLNLLILNPYFSEVGGAEHRIRSLIDEFRNRNEIERIFFVCSDAVYSDNKFEVIRFSTPFLLQKLVKYLIEKFNIKICQQHNWQIIGLGGLKTALKFKIPTIYHLHDLHSVCPRLFMTDGSKIQKPCKQVDENKCLTCVGLFEVFKLEREREILENVDVGIVPSNFYRNKMEKLGVLKGKWRIIYPWVSKFFTDLEVYPLYPKAENRISIYGNLLPFKGAYLIVQALPKIIKEIGNVELRVYSKMGLNELILQARKLKVNRFINYVGIKSKPYLIDEYLSSTLTVIPSQWDEVVNLTCIESVCMGVPVLASSVGSMPELFGDAVEFVDEYDNSNVWAEKIIHFFVNKEKYYRKVAWKRKFYREKFNVSRACQDFLKLYGELTC